MYRKYVPLTLVIPRSTATRNLLFSNQVNSRFLTAKAIRNDMAPRNGTEHNHLTRP
jgi:hypothetical protein